MALYKVIAGVCHSKKTNTLYEGNDIVDGMCFPEDELPVLVKDGFLELQAEETPEEKTAKRKIKE